MEADFFSILRLRPGRYSPSNIDRQYQSVRQEILRAGGASCQRRLDDALIAHALLRDPHRQAGLAKRLERVAAQQPAPAKPAPPKPASVMPAPGIERKPMPPQRLRYGPAVAPPRIREERKAPQASLPDRDFDKDTHAQFARMVLQHVEAGILRFTARQRLMLLAKGLGIGEFKANLIIAEVLHDLSLGAPRAGSAVSGSLTPRFAPSRPKWGPLQFLTLAAAAGGLVDLVLLWTWLTR